MEKCDECKSDKHPDKPNANFRLQKRWWVLDKGIDESKSTELGEKVERSSSEVLGALSCLGLQDVPKKGKSLAEQHRFAIGKLNLSLSKLGRALSSCEQTLPAKKRSLSPQEYGRLRSGVHDCRACRESALDEAEDYKNLEGDEATQQAMIEKIQKLNKWVAEHLDCLVEAMGTKPSVKKEVEKKQEHAAGTTLTREDPRKHTH